MKRYTPSITALNILIVLFIPIFLLLSFLTSYFLNAYPIIMWGIILLFWAVYIIFFMIFLPLYFKNTVYHVSKEDVIKYSGFFIKSQQYMKVSSVQYVTKLFTPFSKYTGFNFLKLNALGGDIVLLFLTKADAEAISSVIFSSIKNII